MRRWITIDIEVAGIWGLDKTEGFIFAYLFEAPSWAAAAHIGGEIWYRVDRSKIVADLGWVVSNPDTCYRVLKRLVDKRLIEIQKIDGKDHIRLLEGTEIWGSRELGKNSEPRKKFRDISEKIPNLHIEIDREIERIPEESGMPTILVDQEVADQMRSDAPIIRKAAIKILNSEYSERFSGLAKDLAFQFVEWAIREGYELIPNRYKQIPGLEKVISFFMEKEYPEGEAVEEEESGYQIFIRKKLSPIGIRRTRRFLRAVAPERLPFYAWTLGYLKDVTDMTDGEMDELLSDQYYSQNKRHYEKWKNSAPPECDTEGYYLDRAARL